MNLGDMASSGVLSGVPVDSSRAVPGVFEEDRGVPLGRMRADIDRVLIAWAATKLDLSPSCIGAVVEEIADVQRRKEGLARRKKPRLSYFAVLTRGAEEAWGSIGLRNMYTRRRASLGLSAAGSHLHSAYFAYTTTIPPV